MIAAASACSELDYS